MQNGEICATVLGIGTSVPGHLVNQEAASQRMAEALSGNKDASRWAKRLFKQCGVEIRYTCEPNLLEPIEYCRYLPGSPAASIPTTSERMAKYEQWAVPLGTEAAIRALEDSGFRPSEISHLITVSCTGQFLPGLDTVLTRRLELSEDVMRIPLTFLGCAAGLTAVRMAKEIVEREKNAVVLIVSVELCTLHIQPSAEREALFATAFFGDGASACVIGMPAQKKNSGFVLGRTRTAWLPNTEEEMVWQVGDFGFDLYLSTRIPALIGAFVPAELDRLLDGQPLPDLWAIHPGGRGIIDTLQTLYRLSDEQTRPSRDVLRTYGNVSSATILFVLDTMRHQLKQSVSGPKSGIAAAFGPGLQTELLLFDYIPAEM